MVQVIRHGSLWRLPHPVFIHPVLTTGSLWSGTNIWPIGCLKSLQKVTLGEHRGVEISAFYCFCMAAVQGGTLGAFNWLRDVGSHQKHLQGSGNLTAQAPLVWENQTSM